MKITILTLFPEFFENPLNTSIIKRAKSKGVIDFEIVNIRDFTLDKNGRVDNPPTGGGAGLIMQCQPIVDALKSVKKDNSHVILPSPRGKKFTQKDAARLKDLEHIIFICGHYEGIDERISAYIDEFFSLGDFILTGGEIPVLAFSDSIMRLLEGAITSESLEDESFNNNLLEYPQYTLPYEFEGQKIPDILFSGNHKAIAKWRKKQSLLLTKKHRPDLFEKYQLSKEDTKLLLEEGTPAWEKEALEKGRKFIK